MNSPKRLQVQYVATAKLVPWQDNPRLNEQAVAPVVKSIRKFGFNAPIVCNVHNRIIAGHTRWKAAKRLGLSKVPVVKINLTPQDESAYAIADNKTGQLAEWDTPKLKQILDRLRSEDTDLNNLGFASRELQRLLGAEVERENTVPKVGNRVRTAPGTLWKLGRHRLLCGDSRFSSTWRRLLGRKKVDLIFAGPPYFNQRPYSHWDDYTAYLEDLNAVIASCHKNLKAGGICVWNVGNGSCTKHNHVSHHASLLEENGLRFVDTIVWRKSAANYGIPRHVNIKRGIYYPAHQWEALHVYQRPGKMPVLSREALQYMWQHPTDVWEIPAVRDQLKAHGHPAVCPVEVPFRCILAYSPEGGIVVDPFSGSGTTLIAAEQAGRTAFAIEKNTGYCDQIVKRWESLTGKKAKRARINE
jgi:DNA modification methylase